MHPKIVILDGHLANPGDLTWDPISALGQLTIYDQTSNEQIVKRSREADVLLVNKVKLKKEHFEHLPNLKLICLLATGYDNVDTSAARQFEITVCNAIDYGSDSVAQHVFALILACTNKVYDHNASVKNGDWSRNSWSYTLGSIRGLKGLTMGVFGAGKIGMRVASLARAFGMNVLIHARNRPDVESKEYTFVDSDQLLSQGDIISYHIPLNKETEGIINSKTLSTMKPDAILVNTARGGLVCEDDLRAHLLGNPQFYAALDVLSDEPPPIDHPLIELNNCILTPHNAWSNIDARRRLIEICAENIRSYFSGQPQNVVS